MQNNATGIFNAAGGNQITLNDLIGLLMKLMGRNISPIYEDIRSGDIKHSFADSSKAKKHFGYQSKYDIKNGLKKTIEWFTKN